MRGLHLMLDLRGCAVEPLHAGDAVRSRVRALCAGVGFTVVGESSYAFAGGGFTFALLLAESHVALHTWPELGSATMDVYVCNFSQSNDLAARELANSIASLFSPSEIVRNEIMRGARSKIVSDELCAKNADFAPQV